MEMIYYRGDHDGDASSKAINTKFKAAKAGAKAESGQRGSKLTPDGVHKMRR